MFFLRDVQSNLRKSYVPINMRITQLKEGICNHRYESCVNRKV
uniref:Uncharacterized protein n=1 Tax=Myoviridae sp. ctzA421 TaxID=2826719 RepID=A0A8S5LTY6_9CAUD|nr:MAG TPA: hypothetical protein [Myoviridae sp. ctzA421]